MHRVNIGHVGKADCNPEFIQFINGTHRLRVITPEAVGALNDDVRELARTCIVQ
ncbi:MAG: hypothetical protein IPO91_34095 [Chloroflexi bacterium]|nr:hypothetical protein [Chloroflexota bacterium]